MLLEEAVGQGECAIVIPLVDQFARRGELLHRLLINRSRRTFQGGVGFQTSAAYRCVRQMISNHVGEEFGRWQIAQLNHGGLSLLP